MRIRAITDNDEFAPVNSLSHDTRTTMNKLFS